MQEYELIRSKRKTISMTVTKTLKVVIRAPLRMSKKEIELFLNKHECWINRRFVEISKANEYANQNILTDNAISSLKEKAKSYIPQRVSFYSDIMGVQPTGIKITSAKARWGSCSSKNSLCFPYRIMLLPEAIIDYIVVHELAHIVEKNHSKCFYRVVQQYMPDYKEREKQLKAVQFKLPQ